jgi:hypothetical protein
MDAELLLKLLLGLIGIAEVVYGGYLLAVSRNLRSQSGHSGPLFWSFPVRGGVMVFAGVAFLLAAASVAPRLMIVSGGLLLLGDPLIRRITLRLEKTRSIKAAK